MKTLLLTCLLAALPLAPAGAQAAGPDQPITVVVPFGAGGGVDPGARVVLPRPAERLGPQTVSENQRKSLAATVAAADIEVE
jgi:tripartite-type tricarboxylate transporter receptor subunit TctC